MKDFQKRMLEILLEFDRVAKKHNLTYWLDHGTLLGAIRHKGFIPWDDDLDISMPREDYERFKSLKDELPDWIFFQSKDNEPSIPIQYIKLRDKNSIYIDEWEENKDIKYHQGIFIDIFPVNSIERKYIPIYKNIMNFSKIFSNRYLRVDFLAKPLIHLMNKFHKSNNNWCVSGGEYMHFVVNFSKDDIFPLAEVEFEGYGFPAPKNYDLYLKQIFGDYMRLPPQEKRKIHATEIKIIK